jgi:hypothetical protein
MGIQRAFAGTGELIKHYQRVHKRLLQARQTWHTPTIKEIWRTPRVEFIGLRGISGPPSLLRIIALTIEEYNVSWDEIINSCKFRRIVHARQCLYYHCLKHTELSAARIAKLCKRNHATVLYGANMYCKLYGLPRPRTLRFVAHNLSRGTDAWNIHGPDGRFVRKHA